MNISKEGIAITKRFFEAIDMLKAQKRMRGLLTYTKAHDINYWNINTVRNQPEVSVLKPEWIAYLVLDYGISADWILTEKRRKVVTILPGVSYGSAELQENESICDTKARADQHMYDNKKEHKEQRKTS